MLPTKSTLSLKIQSLVKNNSETDSEKAIKHFADELAKILLDSLNDAVVSLPPSSINTVVTTSAGAGTGVNAIECFGNLK